MALKRRETTRFARVGTWITTGFSFVLDVLGSFLNFKEEESFLKKGIKTADTMSRLTVYTIADYGLWLVSVGIFTTMKALGFSFLWIFAALWAYEFVAASVFVAFYEETGKDVSLGEDIRRATDTIRARSRLIGYITMAWVVGKAILWSGPERFVTFFREEIGTTRRIIVTILVLTAFQSFFWAVLYNLGYGLVVG